LYAEAFIARLNYNPDLITTTLLSVAMKIARRSQPSALSITAKGPILSIIWSSSFIGAERKIAALSQKDCQKDIKRFCALRYLQRMCNEKRKIITKDKIKVYNGLLPYPEEKKEKKSNVLSVQKMKQITNNGIKIKKIMIPRRID